MIGASGVPLSTCYGHRNAKAYNEVRKRGKEAILGREVTTRYFQQVRNDDFVYEFVIINPVGWQIVFTDASDGSRQVWKHYWTTDGLLVFVAPDGYSGGPFTYAHSKKCVADALVYESDKVWSFGNG